MASLNSISTKFSSYIKEYKKKSFADGFLCKQKRDGEDFYGPINGYFHVYKKDIKNGTIKVDSRNIHLPDNKTFTKVHYSFKKEIVDRYHPDNFSSNIFWKKITKEFPFPPIIQANVHAGIPKTSHEINLISLSNLHIPIRTAPRLLYLIEESKQTAKILEIGPGYGCIPLLLKDHCKKEYENYYAIDVNPLFKHPNIYECDGKSIPSKIPYGIDIVYSVNVFQHLSKNQRSSYYKQIFSVLKPGGKFIFSMFIETLQNKYEDCWGYKDEEEKKYTHFFGQFTEVDNEFELIKELQSIGFEINVLHNEHVNHKALELTKPLTEEI